jgi:hypothetical protein
MTHDTCFVADNTAPEVVLLRSCRNSIARNNKMKKPDQELTPSVIRQLQKYVFFRIFLLEK